jgi:hypothetical protein
MLPNQDPSRIERDLLEQNPALEWNTHSGWVSILSGTSELGGEEGQPPPLPLTRRGKGGKGALSIYMITLAK